MAKRTALRPCDPQHRRRDDATWHPSDHCISTLGAGDTRADVGWFARNILFGFILRDEVADKEAMEDYLAATDLDWTVVRVGILVDGPAKDHFRAGDDHTIRGMGKITRQNVARFMIAQTESPQWLRRKPVLVH